MDDNLRDAQETASLIECPETNQNSTDSASDDEQQTVSISSAVSTSTIESTNSVSVVAPRQNTTSPPVMTRPRANMSLPCGSGSASAIPANSHPNRKRSSPNRQSASNGNGTISRNGDHVRSSHRHSNGTSSSNESLTGSSNNVVKCSSPAKNHAPRNRYHHLAANRASCGGSPGSSSGSPIGGTGSNGSPNGGNGPPPIPITLHQSVSVSNVDRIVPVSSTSSQSQSVPFFINVTPPHGNGPDESSTDSTPSEVSITSSSPRSSTASVHNWQSMKMSMAERLAFLFNNETLSDVKFVVGRGTAQQRIPAHKFILSIGSAVFNAMFNGSMATNATEIDLPDVEPAAFMFLLKFLYTDEAHIGPDTVMTTLYTAKKYAVPALECQCVDFLKRNLNAENAFMLLSQARLFDEQQLADLCLETIDKCTTEAINAEGFVDIDLETLCSVLRRDTLSIRECKLFQAIVRWADAECQRQQIASTADNKRQVLGDATAMIRFPLMSVEEFASCAQTKILQDKEIVNLFLYFTCNPKPKVEFVDKPRCYLSGCEYTLTRFKQVDCRWGYSGTPDKIRYFGNYLLVVMEREVLINCGGGYRVINVLRHFNRLSALYSAISGGFVRN